MRFLMIVAAIFLVEATAYADIGGTFLLERLGQRDWKASFCFDEPVSAIGFTRPIPGLRQASWVSATDDVSLDFTERVAKLQRADSQPFACGAVMLKTDTRVPVKDYMAFSTFSDGGVSLYTGFLVGQVYKDGEWHDYDLKASYKGLPGDQVITRKPDTLDHQFVYFGAQQVLSLPEATLVIDPAMPVEARDAVLTTMPEVNRQLHGLFGYQPSEPYLVFMAAGELYSSPEAHTKGGTQPYQILFTIKGERALNWAVRDPLYFPQFTAHEVMHIWQNDTWYRQLGADEPWLHEGMADAMSYEMMRLTGAYSPEKYQDMWRRAEEGCQKGLAETSVHGAADAGRFDLIYSCGALVNWLVGEAISPESPGQGIIHVWQAMGAWEKTRIEQTPSEALFLETMAELGFSETARKALVDFLDNTFDDPEAAIAGLRLALAQGTPQAGAG